VLTLLIKACGSFDHRESTVIQRICQEVCMQLPTVREMLVAGTACTHTLIQHAPCTHAPCTHTLIQHALIPHALIHHTLIHS
jgi:hypothetical protein